MKKFPTKPEVKYRIKEGISAKCIPNLNKGSEIIEFTTREGKLIMKERPSSYLLKELNVIFITKVKAVLRM